MNPNNSKDSGSENFPPTFNNITFESNFEDSTSSHVNTSYVTSQQTFLQSSFHPNAFFYRPPNDTRNYHINCIEISLDMAIQLLNEFIDNASGSNFNQNEYRFYYQQRNYRIYQVSCEA